MIGGSKLPDELWRVFRARSAFRASKQHCRRGSVSCKWPPRGGSQRVLLDIARDPRDPSFFEQRNTIFLPSKKRRVARVAVQGGHGIAQDGSQMAKRGAIPSPNLCLREISSSMAALWGHHGLSSTSENDIGFRQMALFGGKT